MEIAVPPLATVYFRYDKILPPAKKPAALEAEGTVPPAKPRRTRKAAPKAEKAPVTEPKPRRTRKAAPKAEEVSAAEPKPKRTRKKAAPANPSGNPAE